VGEVEEKGKGKEGMVRMVKMVKMVEMRIGDGGVRKGRSYVQGQLGIINEMNELGK
jgi:hypothetical protein